MEQKAISTPEKINFKIIYVKSNQYGNQTYTKNHRNFIASKAMFWSIFCWRENIFLYNLARKEHKEIDWCHSIRKRTVLNENCIILMCWWSLYLTSFVFWRPKKKFKNFLESIALSRNTAHKVKLI